MLQLKCGHIWVPSCARPEDSRGEQGSGNGGRRARKRPRHISSREHVAHASSSVTVTHCSRGQPNCAAALLRIGLPFWRLHRPAACTDLFWLYIGQTRRADAAASGHASGNGRGDINGGGCSQRMSPTIGWLHDILSQRVTTERSRPSGTKPRYGSVAGSSRAVFSRLTSPPPPVAQSSPLREAERF